MFKAILILSLIAIGSASPLLVGRGWGGGPVLAGGAVIIDKPIPYAFGYDTQDGYGTVLTRAETGDGNGSVKGSYSYKDAQGLNRIVEYVADGNGFRANVKTNEPGTINSNPADVQILANPVIVGPKLIAKPILG